MSHTKSFESTWNKARNNTAFYPLLFVTSNIVLFFSRIRRNLLLEKSYTPSIPTVCVGNISLGGSGKTPTVLYLQKILQEHLDSIAVLSRGYQGSLGEKPHFVSATDTPKSTGDEPLLYLEASRKSDFVIISRKRKPALRLLSDLSCKAVLMDDGLQHYAVSPHIKLCLIALEDIGLYLEDPCVFPASGLRELPEDALPHMHRIVFTKKSPFDQVDKANIESTCERYGIKKYSSLEFSTKEILTHDSKKASPTSVELLTSVAKPSSVKYSIESSGFKVATSHIFPDHHHFSQSELDSILEHSSLPIVCTKKDWVKIERFNLSLDRFYIVHQNVTDCSPQGEKLDEWLLSELKSFS